MSMHPRQQKLLDEVRAHRTLSVEGLARTLGVTPQTVRRDVNLLAHSGLLMRYHGGVSIPGATTENIDYLQRKSLNAGGKRRIAREVAAQVPHGCSVFLNIGTTTEEVARALLHHRDLRVVTNNLNVAAILAQNAECEVIVAGGVVRSRDHGIVGEATVDFIRQFRVDIGLIGVSSIEHDGTLRDFDFREVKVAQTIISHSREVWLVADHTKFNREAMVELGHLSQIDALFSDAPIPDCLHQLLEESGGRVEIALPTGKASP